MQCKLLIIDEEGIIELCIGSIKTNIMSKLVHFAEDRNLIFLQSIDPKGDTIFNAMQLDILKEELSCIAHVDWIKNDLFLIKVATDEALAKGEYMYLKISCG